MWENVRDPVATGSSFAIDWLKLGHTRNCKLSSEKRKKNRLQWQIHI